MARKKTGRVAKPVAKKYSVVEKAYVKRGGLGLAIVSLILNVLILPGLGTLVAGKMKIGAWQLVLAVVGIILSFYIIGIPILIAAWIWGLITGIQLIQEKR